MSDRNRIIFKAIGMFTAYSAVMFALIYFLNRPEPFGTGKIITLVMWLLFGIWQSYRWMSEKFTKLKKNQD